MNYKSKTSTETVWQYKTFRAVSRLPLAVTEANADSLAVTEALHTSCDQVRCADDGRTIIHSQLWGSLRLAPIISKGILILLTSLLDYIVPLFLSVSELPCIWQQEKAVMTLWNALLSKELTSLKIRMGYVGGLYVLLMVDRLAASYTCGR